MCAARAGGAAAALGARPARRARSSTPPPTRPPPSRWWSGCARGRAATGRSSSWSPATAGVLDRVEAIHCGADGHFTKPVDVGALVRRLRFLLERERAEPPRVLSVEDDPQQAAFLRTVLDVGRLRGARGRRRPGAPGSGAGRLPARPRADGRAAARRERIRPRALAAAGRALRDAARHHPDHARRAGRAHRGRPRGRGRVPGQARLTRACSSRRWRRASSAGGSCASSSSATA